MLRQGSVAAISTYGDLPLGVKLVNFKTCENVTKLNSENSIWS